jgi:hypothetical protein
MQRPIFWLTGVICIFFVSLTGTAFSQNHYWTQQYGARSSLLSGAVVGGVRDNSALYYNPGALGFIENNHLSISANMYGMDLIRLKNAAGNDLNLESTRPFFYPQLISGLINIPKKPKIKIAYGLLSRYNSTLRMLAVNEMEYDVIPNSPGDEFYRGKVEYELNNQSIWGGLGVSYKINDIFSVGGTMFINYLHVDDRLILDLSADAHDSLGTYTTKYYNSNYHNIDHFGLNWKLGVAVNLKRLKLGLTLTTPSVSLFGWGKMSRAEEAYNMNRYLPPSDRLGKSDTYILADDKRGLDVTFLQPFSIGFGLEYWFNKTRISMSAELFFPIQTYEIMRSPVPTVLRPTDVFGDTIPDFMVVRNSTVGVFNVALGLQQQLTDKFDLFLGARTDFNNTRSLDPTEANGTSLNPSFWHYFHFSAGATYHRGLSDVTLGINYGIGLTTQRSQLINLSAPDGAQLLQGPKLDIMKSNVHNIGLIVGFTYYIRRPVKKEIPD